MAACVGLTRGAPGRAGRCGFRTYTIRLSRGHAACHYAVMTPKLSAGPADDRSPSHPDAGHAHGPALSLEPFLRAYGEWKTATVEFERAVRRMHAGDVEARVEAQAQARRLAQLHHSFLETSQPYFAASADAAADRDTSEAPPGTVDTEPDVCVLCGGTGRIGLEACRECRGTGLLIVASGGG